ncbi:hypothetical protein X798_07252, partial [Onchocerca flexuosa]
MNWVKTVDCFLLRASVVLRLKTKDIYGDFFDHHQLTLLSKNSSLGSTSATTVTYPSTTGASHFYANAVNTSATGAAYPTVQSLSQPA